MYAVNTHNKLSALTDGFCIDATKLACPDPGVEEELHSQMDLVGNG